MTDLLHQGADRFHLLIIEDDYETARMMLLALHNAKLECHYAPNGQRGLSAFVECRPHLILLDITLPDVSGFEVCERIRGQNNVPILMISGREGEEDLLRSFKLGADDFIAKPFKPRSLVARVTAHLRRVYQYDAAPVAHEETPAEATSPASSGLPLGWLECEFCHYMGPERKFRQYSSQNEVTLVCPHCNQASSAFPFLI